MIAEDQTQFTSDAVPLHHFFDAAPERRWVRVVETYSNDHWHRRVEYAPTPTGPWS